MATSKCSKHVASREGSAELVSRFLDIGPFATFGGLQEELSRVLPPTFACRRSLNPRTSPQACLRVSRLRPSLSWMFSENLLAQKVR